MEVRVKEVRTAEESERCAMQAMAWFADVAARTEKAHIEASLSEVSTTSPA